MYVPRKKKITSSKKISKIRKKILAIKKKINSCPIAVTADTAAAVDAVLSQSSILASPSDNSGIRSST